MNFTTFQDLLEPEINWL